MKTGEIPKRALPKSAENLEAQNPFGHDEAWPSRVVPSVSWRDALCRVLESLGHDEAWPSVAFWKGGGTSWRTRRINR